MSFDPSNLPFISHNINQQLEGPTSTSNDQVSTDYDLISKRPPITEPESINYRQLSSEPEHSVTTTPVNRKGLDSNSVSPDKSQYTTSTKPTGFTSPVNYSERKPKPITTSNFQFSYDASRRIHVAVEAIRRLEEEMGKILTNYNTNLLLSHTLPFNFNTINNGSATNSLSQGLDISTFKTATTGKTTANRSNAFGSSTVNARLAGIFTYPLNYTPMKATSPGYSKTLTQLKTLLTKNHRKVNGYLPLSRRLLAFLFLPFATRPLNESDCHLALSAIQNILLEFPLDSSNQISRIIHWCLAALHVSNHSVASKILDKVEFLISESKRRPNLALEAPALIEFAILLVHYLGAVGTTRLGHRDGEAIYSQVQSVLDRMLGSRDMLMDRHYLGSSDLNGSRFLTLAYSLLSPIASVQKYALKLLNELEWPNPNEYATQSFYKTFINSAHVIMVSFVSDPAFSHDTMAHQLLQLVYKYYPATLRDQQCYDEATWYLVTRCTLLAFGLGVTAPDESFGSHLDTRSKILRVTSLYLQSCIRNRMGTIITTSINSLISECDLNIAIPIYMQVTLESPDKKFSEQLLNATISILYDRFFCTPNLIIIESLQSFFLELKSSYVQTIYKPILSLIQSQDCREVSRLLLRLQFLTQVLSGPTLLFTEPDLLCVVLFSSMGPHQPYALGQVVFLCHLIVVIQTFKATQGDEQQPEYLSMVRSLLEFERQITLFLLARERLQQPELSPVLKNLILHIFLEIRVFASSRKRPGWLGVVLSWLDSKHVASLLEYDYSFIVQDINTVHAIVQLQSRDPPSQVYLKKLSLPTLHHRTGDTFTSNPTESPSPALTSPDLVSDTPFSPFFLTASGSPVFPLLTSVYFHLTEEEFNRTLPLLWKFGLDFTSSRSNPWAQLLILLAGEYPGVYVETFILNQLRSTVGPNPLAQLETFTALFSARRSLLSHLSVADPVEKPFKRAGPNLSFVSSMVGTFEPVLQESRWLERLKLSGTSLEEIKMIQSLGWDEEDEDDDEELASGAPERWRSGNQLVTLSSSTFDEVFLAEYESESRSDEPVSIHRKKPILTPLMGSIFIRLTRELSTRLDPQMISRTSLLYNVMRDEPSWFLRLLLNPLEDYRDKGLESYLTDIAQVISLKPKLPLQFGYHTFNYLTGWLRWLYRETQVVDLAPAAQVVPLLARLLPSSHEITFRELRKAKLDVVLFCDGRFVLPEPNSLFRITYRNFHSSVSSPHASVILQVLPKPLFHLGLLRISQSHFMTRLLERSPHDVFQLARSLFNFEPINWVFSSPGQGTHAAVPLIPDRGHQQHLTLKLANPLSVYHIEFRSFSSLHSHAWLGFLERLFEYMDWNYQDRRGLEILLEGINRILLSHHNDLPLLARSVRLLVRIALQFRRLFNIKSGYTLFISALFQFYFVTQDPASRSGIQFAVALFFNLHQESFVFQMLGSLVPVILELARQNPESAPVMSRALFEWFMCLEKKPVDDPFNLIGSIPPQARPIALPEESRLGIRNFLARRTKLLHHEGSITDFKHFTVADSLRLFITIIAYDPGSLRSEQFVIILQHLLPFLMKSISASDLVDFSIKSIIPVFVRFSKSRSIVSRVLGMDHPQPTEEDLGHAAVGAHYDKNWPQNDRTTIRIELFRLVGALLDLGGELSLEHYDKLSYILKSVIKANSSFSRGEGPLVVFINRVIRPTRDSALRANLALKVLTMLTSAFSSCTRPFNVADVLTGIGLLTHDFVGSSTLQPPDQFHILLPTFLTLGCQSFFAIDPSHIEGSQIIGKALVHLFSVMLRPFPQETLKELRNLQTSSVSLSYLLVPLCLEFIPDDGFLYQFSFYQPELKQTVQRLWAILLGLLSSPLIRTNSKSASGSKEDHPMAASLDFLLSLVGIKVIMLRAHHLLFQEIPSSSYQVDQMIQSYVFDALNKKLRVQRSKIPYPVRSYGAWKMASFLTSTNDAVFLPLFANQIKQLREVNPATAQALNSNDSSQFNISSPVMPPSPRGNADNMSHHQDLTPVLLVEGVDIDDADATPKPPHRLQSFRFSRGRLQPRLTISSTTSDARDIWSGVSINHVLTQLEMHAFTLQACPLYPQSYTSAFSSARNSTPSSPSSEVRPWADILAAPGSHPSNNLAIPTLQAPPSGSRPLSAVSTDSLLSSHDLSDTPITIDELLEELKFILTTFGFPTPSLSL